MTPACTACCSKKLLDRRALLNRLHHTEEDAVGAAKALLDSHSAVTVADTAFAARMVVATVESLTHRLLACEKPADAEQLEDGIVAMLSAYLRGH